MKKYLPNSPDYAIMADAPSTGPGRVIMSAARLRRDELLGKVDKNPVRSDELKHDLVYILGQINVLNWILELPDKARKVIDKLPETEL